MDLSSFLVLRRGKPDNALCRFAFVRAPNTATGVSLNKLNFTGLSVLYVCPFNANKNESAINSGSFKRCVENQKTVCVP